MTAVVFRYKGSAKSGNYLHAGRIGKVGGSQAYSIAGRTVAEWSDEQRSLSSAGREKVLEDMKVKHPDLAEKDVADWLDRQEEHRAGVLHEALDLAQEYYLDRNDQQTLVDNLVQHDADKYDADIAAAYVNRHNDRDAFWKAVGEHHDSASHHPQYWIQPGTHGKRADRMPYPNAIEMVADQLATAKEYGTRPSDWYNKNKHSVVLHPDTRTLLEKELAKADVKWDKDHPKPAPRPKPDVEVPDTKTPATYQVHGLNPKQAGQQLSLFDNPKRDRNTPESFKVDTKKSAVDAAKDFAQDLNGKANGQFVHSNDKIAIVKQGLLSSGWTAYPDAPKISTAYHKDHNDRTFKAEVFIDKTAGGTQVGIVDVTHWVVGSDGQLQKRTPEYTTWAQGTWKQQSGKEMTIQFRYKGSSKSGNYMHAGIPGHVGGSAPRPTR